MLNASLHSQLAAQVNRLQGVTILCIGDIMLDRFVYGDVERISPEAPIPVLRQQRDEVMLGGAGNVLRNLVALGASTAFVSAVGDDSIGREITRLIGDQERTDPRIVVEHGRQTTIKTRFFAGGQQLLRVDQETVNPVQEDTVGALQSDIGTVISRVDVVTLSDYGKGVLSRTVLKFAIQQAQAAGKPIIVDPKGRDYSLYAGATLVTPNRKELAEATGLPADSDDDVVTAARTLIETCGIQNVLVTRSEKGMTLVLQNGQVTHLSAEAREVFDVSGAGDTVVATVAASLGAGLSLEDAARLSNVAAGIVVGKVGTAVINHSDLVDGLYHENLRAGEAKVLSLEKALEKLAVWRRKGLRIGFTNGCFDLLHPGHISLLNQARAACDRLIVGLNSDESVQRLKGPTRPVQSQAARATVLASLSNVDCVVVFDEDTPLALIEAFRPDVLVKGADYTVETVVGAAQVQAHGGTVLLAHLEDGHSTTSTIARMAR